MTKAKVSRLWIRELIGRGLSDAEVATRVGLCRSMVSRLRRAMNLPKNFNGREWDPERLRADVARLHAEGLTDRAIAERVGRDPTRVGRIRQGLGLAKNYGGPPWTPTERRQVLGWLEQNWSIGEVAQALGQTYQTVRCRLQRMGFAGKAKGKTFEGRVRSARLRFARMRAKVGELTAAGVPPAKAAGLAGCGRSSAFKYRRGVPGGGRSTPKAKGV